MPYDELKTACHKAFLVPENQAVEKTHKYWAYNTGNRTTLSNPGFHAASDWGDYRTIKKVNFDHRKETDETNDFRKVSYMVILCILIFPFAVLAELMKMNK